VPADNPAEAAETLREEGLHLFPLGTAGETPPDWMVKRFDGDIERARQQWPKTPRFPWQEYQLREPSDAEFEGWCKRAPGCNWAIATGVKVVVVDADTAEGVAFMESGAVTVTGRRVRTAKGAHFYYAVTEEFQVRNSAGAHIDIRGFGGYVVAEGSVHESGHVYTRDDLTGFDVSAAFLPHLTRDDVIAIGAFNKRRSAIEGPIVKDGVLNFDATTVSPDGEAITDEWVPEGQRNVAASRLAGKYIGAGDDLQTVKAKLDEWNSNNPNPLSQNELNTTIASIARTHTARNPQKLIQIEPKRFEDVPIYDLFALMDSEKAQPPYLVDGLFRQGDNVILAGPPKSMKSFLMQDMLFGLAWGRTFLGREVANEVPVAWVQAEMPWYETQRRALAHPWALERRASGRPSNLFVTDRLSTLAFDERGVDYLIDLMIKRFEGEVPSVLAIDSLAAVWAEDSENDNAQMQIFLRERLGRFREAFGEQLTIVLIHHANKTKVADMRKEPFAALRGASALRGWYSAGMVMFKEGTTDLSAEIHFELRGEAPIEPTKVQLENGVLVKFEEPTIDIAGMVLNTVEQEFMNFFDKFEAEGRNMNGSPQARTGFAPREFAELKHPAKVDGRSRRLTAAQFTGAMSSLVAKGKLIYKDTTTGTGHGSKKALVRAEQE